MVREERKERKERKRKGRNRKGEKKPMPKKRLNIFPALPQIHERGGSRTQFL